MNNEEKYGYLKLAKKSLAVLTASLSTLFSDRSDALPTPTHYLNPAKELNYKTFQNQILKSKLVLKISPNDPDKYLLAMHVSHSSHSSHSSHASHSSHISSTPSYTPSTPIYTPSPDTTINSESLTYYTLGSRSMYKGCEGTDVKEMQEMLSKLGYDVLVTGYFGEKTTDAVKKFQKKHELKPDGSVGSKTLEVLRKQSDGN
jgi:murein L,D-transpeptidase YcbB/YkuD